MSTNNLTSVIEVLHLNLPGVVIFPGMTLSITVTVEKAVRKLDQAWRNRQQVLLIPDCGENQSTEIGCLIEIVSFQFDGDHNGAVILRGLRRQQVSGIVHNSNMSEEVLDVYQCSNQADRQVQRKELLKLLYETFPTLSENSFLSSALECELPFGTICDLLAASLQLDAQQYRQILSELDVDLRSKMILEIRRQQAQTAQYNRFPPAFSLN